MTTRGHNSAARIDEVTRKKLNSGISRIRKLRAERKELGADITDIRREMKGIGFDMKAVNEIIRELDEKEKDTDKWQEKEDALMVYRVALGLED